MIDLKPPLPSSILTQVSELRKLYLNGTWKLISFDTVHGQFDIWKLPCPTCNTLPEIRCDPETPPSGPIPCNIVTLTPYHVIMPGPCGKVGHTIWAGLCPVCDIVYWQMGAIQAVHWTDCQLMEIASSQDADLSSYSG